MNPDRVPKEDGKTFEAYNIVIEQQYLDEDYNLEQKANQTIGQSGLLTLFEITDKASGSPCFLGRWDQRKETLDGDILGVCEAEISPFKDEADGYSGHHTTPVASERGRAFQVRLRTPGKKVFEATCA